MRVAFSILTLLVLAGCALAWGDSYHVAMANSRTVVIEFDPALVVFNRSSMLNAAQQECSKYGKDAVFDREERGGLGIVVNHYRCQTRIADKVIDVQ